MIVTLLWMTVSAPFVVAASHMIAQERQMHWGDLSDNDEQSCNPFGNNTEEKASSTSTSFSEEYLHHTDEQFHAAELASQHSRCQTVKEYVAFHGEMLCPPPNTIA